MRLIKIDEKMRQSLIATISSRKQLQENGCILWTGSKAGRYGQIRRTINGSLVYIAAHRASYMVFVKNPGRMHVLHKCDNTFCIRPEHLFLGTHQENMSDMVAKKRSCRKIPIAERDKILNLRERGLTLIEIAKKYGCSEATVHNLINKKTGENQCKPR